MKLFDIAWKDMIRSFRNAFFLVFALGVPLLATAIFYFAFGGLGSGDDSFELPRTKVQVVNLDRADPQVGGFSAGQFLVDFLKADQLAALVQVTEVDDVASARAAVDRQEAAVAVVIPADYSAVAFGPMGNAAIELYQDPTLTLGPSIVKGIIRQFVDGFAGSKIAVQVAAEQLGQHGVTLDAGILGQIAMDYGDWARRLGESQQGGTNALLEVRAPGGAQEEQEANGVQRVLGLIMTGMMVFYAFYTGAATSMSILQEDESGTLPRLFTTPTPQSAILGGKFLSTFVTIVVQVTVLLLFAALVFGINWEQPMAVALVSFGLVVVATGFGILVNSLLKSTRQSGIVYGGVLTVTGMIGMVSVFTGGVPGSNRAVETASLITPQGWAVRGYSQLLAGGGVSDILLTVAVMVVLGGLFFCIGVWRFRKRFA